MTTFDVLNYLALKMGFKLKIIQKPVERKYSNTRIRVFLLLRMFIDYGQQIALT